MTPALQQLTGIATEFIPSDASQGTEVAVVAPATDMVDGAGAVLEERGCESAD